MRKNRYIIIGILILILMAKGSVQAEQVKQAGVSEHDLARKISVPALLNYAYDNNPSIKSAKPFMPKTGLFFLMWSKPSPRPASSNMIFFFLKSLNRQKRQR